MQALLQGSIDYMGERQSRPIVSQIIVTGARRKFLKKMLGKYEDGYAGRSQAVILCWS